jgi:Family of unknown function (DUF6130)
VYRISKGENANQLIKTLAEDTAIATGAFAQSTVVPIDNEPTPRLIVEPPLPGPLAQGVVFIPYRVENLRILPVGGAAARDVSPRVGHLHIRVDDLPWQWADYGSEQHRPRGQRLHRANSDVQLAGRTGSAMTLDKLAAAFAFAPPGLEPELS